MYKSVNSLILIMFVRYPDDLYDWMYGSCMKILIPGQRYPIDMINGAVKNYPNDTYGAPSAVMLSVSSSSNVSKTMRLWWSILDSSMKVYANTMSLVVRYFIEVEILQNEFREFDILLDDLPLVSAFRPEQMLTTVVTELCKPQVVMMSPLWRHQGL